MSETTPNAPQPTDPKGREDATKSVAQSSAPKANESAVTSVPALIAEARALDAAASPSPWRDGILIDTDEARAGDERGVMVVPASTPHASGHPDVMAHGVMACRGMTGPKRVENSQLIARYRTLALELADALESALAHNMAHDRAVLALVAERGELEKACRLVCPPAHDGEPEEGEPRFCLFGEEGEPLLVADTPGELVRELWKALGEVQQECDALRLRGDALKDRHSEREQELADARSLVDALRDDITQLRAERDALAKDAGRLDWLETHTGRFAGWDPAAVSRALAAKPRSFREAIDAAATGSAPAGPPGSPSPDTGSARE